MARPALTTQQRDEQDRRQRRSLLRGMAACVADKGYAATTIADIVREARVSKSTFYAQFADKEQCYVALYSAATDNVLAAMAQADHDARAAELAWPEHLRAVNAVYLQALAAGEGLARSLLVEIQTAGPAAVAMRREVLDRYVRLMRRVTDGLRRDDPQLNRLPPATVLAVVGGINEIVVHALETGSVASIMGLDEIAVGLWAAVLTAPAPAPQRR